MSVQLKCCSAECLNKKLKQLHDYSIVEMHDSYQTAVEKKNHGTEAAISRAAEERTGEILCLLFLYLCFFHYYFFFSGLLLGFSWDSYQ